jgi:hypothetical protein
MHHSIPVDFQISALPAEPFRSLFALSDAELAARGARWQVVSAGTPCRVSLEDAAIGETVLLLPYEHQAAAGSPYRSAGAIFVRPDVPEARPAVNEVPESVRRRLLSVRAYDSEGMMIDADVAEGRVLEDAIARFFADPQVAYLHLHNARPGCYNCRVDRA